MAEVTPVTLLIGLAGAGKTTLLTHVMRHPDAAGVAVVTAQADPLMRWNAGCLCCAPRDDVARALRAVLPSARRDEVRRIVIETTGLADPGPILATLLSDPVAASAFRLDAIVTVLQAAVAGGAQPMPDIGIRQIALADRIVLSRPDLADPQLARTRLQRLNPWAPVVIAPDGAVDPGVLLASGSPGPQDMPRETPREMIAEDDGIQAFGLTIAPPLPWPAISTWLERLILLHGDAVLRMRAVLNVQDRPGPVVIHSARHLLVPPVTLPSWPAGASRQTRLAFITRGLPRASIVEALASIAPSADNPAATA